jgi:hypothetical protein
LQPTKVYEVRIRPIKLPQLLLKLSDNSDGNRTVKLP